MPPQEVATIFALHVDLVTITILLTAISMQLLYLNRSKPTLHISTDFIMEHNFTTF